MNKKCLLCNKIFNKRLNENSIYWIAKKFCSRECYGLSKKGIIPKNVKLWKKGEHISLNTEFKKGQTSIRKGIKQPQSKEWLEKRIKAIPRGNKHHNWKGGITPINEKIRKSPRYVNWRMAVYKRDNFTCINCGYKSKGNGDIRADHIKPFSLYPDLRFTLSNGRTLCKACDVILGWNYRRSLNQFYVVGQNL